MNKQVKTKKKLLNEEQKERHFAELFNQCMQKMNDYYRKRHPICEH